jgi:hypothetical protein
VNHEFLNTASALLRADAADKMGIAGLNGGQGQTKSPGAILDSRRLARRGEAQGCVEQSTADTGIFTSSKINNLLIILKQGGL